MLDGFGDRAVPMMIVAAARIACVLLPCEASAMLLPSCSIHPPGPSAVQADLIQ
jgi:hypothetical protein